MQAKVSSGRDLAGNRRRRSQFLAVPRLMFPPLVE